MDDDAAEGLVLHPECGRFSILNLEVMRGVVQAVALRGLDLHGVIGAILQRDKDAAIFIRGHSVDQLIIDLPDFKGHIGDALTGIRSIDLDKLNASDGIVIKGERLGILGVDLHRLDPCGFIDGVSLDGFGLLGHDCARDAADADLAIGVGSVEALAGQVAVGVVHVSAVRIGQLELNASERFLCHGIQLPDDEGTLGLLL